MKRLIFVLEEPSAEEMLKEILPKILPASICPEFNLGFWFGFEEFPRKLSGIESSRCLA